MVTNYIKNATYKEIYDIHTDTETTSIMTLHTPINTMPREMLKGFFSQYRRFKYRGMSLRLRPVARLPADPEQISYDAGEQGIDPRDLMDPVLFRGYSGESLGTFLNNFMVPGPQAKSQLRYPDMTVYESFSNDGWYGSSVDKTSFFDQENAADWRSTYLEKLYYQSLSDPGFRKIKPQGGFRKFLYPLVYEMATTTQRLAHNGDSTSTGMPVASSSVAEVGQLVYDRTLTSNQAATANNLARNELEGMSDAMQANDVQGTNRVARKFADYSSLPIQFIQSKSSSQDQNRWYYVRKTTPILTSHKRRLGWLDTDSVVVPAGTIDGTFLSASATAIAVAQGLPPAVADPMNAAGFAGYETKTTLPLINMGVLIFPKAHKQEMHWRMEIVHHFDFCKYRPMYGLVNPFDYSNLGAGPILEWSDWDNYGEQVYPVSSVTSNANNLTLVDVQGGNAPPETA